MAVPLRFRGGKGRVIKIKKMRKKNPTAKVTTFIKALIALPLKRYFLHPVILIISVCVEGEKPLRIHLRTVHGDLRFPCPEPGCNVTAKNRKAHTELHIRVSQNNTFSYFQKAQFGLRFYWIS